MFLTITINTAQKKKSRVRVHKRNIDLTRGFRKTLKIKRRSIWQRLKAWRRSLKNGVYKLGDQIFVR